MTSSNLTRDELTEVLAALLPAVTDARRRVAESLAVPAPIRADAWDEALRVRVSAMVKLTALLAAEHPIPPKAGPR